MTARAERTRSVTNQPTMVPRARFAENEITFQLPARSRLSKRGVITRASRASKSTAVLYSVDARLTTTSGPGDSARSSRTSSVIREPQYS
ncbi:Uncharacterised protein [Mycobacteroides abscessus subsp. abscessus]|nr:Uncharacterised protein [Mycobacteroides abscessus subsp. abscessus]